VTEFPVTKISAEIFGGATAIRIGAAEKYRIDLPGSGAVVLKNDDESLNGAWVEKITCELAKLMGIPAARYELAELVEVVSLRPLAAKVWIDSDSKCWRSCCC
jgi:hypothetical protein